METVTFKKHIYTDKITTTVYGEKVEIRKRKMGKRDVYSYRIGLRSWGKYLSRVQLNRRLRQHGVKVENVRA